MVETRRLKRRHELLGTKLLQAFGRQIQMLQSPLHLLAGDWLALSELFLSYPYSFHSNNGDHYAPIVANGPNILLPAVPFTFAVSVLQNIL